MQWFQRYSTLLARALRGGTFVAATSKQILCFQFSSPLIGRFLLHALNVTNQNLFSLLDISCGHQINVRVHKLLADYHGIWFITGMIQMGCQRENTSNPWGHLFLYHPIHSSFQLLLRSLVARKRHGDFLHMRLVSIRISSKFAQQTRILMFIERERK